MTTTPSPPVGLPTLLACPHCGAVPRETAYEWRVYHTQNCFLKHTTVIEFGEHERWNTRTPVAAIREGEGK